MRVGVRVRRKPVGTERIKLVCEAQESRLGDNDMRHAVIKYTKEPGELSSFHKLSYLILVSRASTATLGQ